jgi:hypothetical protein
MVRLLDQVMVPRVPTRKERTEIERMDHRTAQPNQARVCAESTVYTVCVEPQGIAPVRLRFQARILGDATVAKRGDTPQDGAR